MNIMTERELLIQRILNVSERAFDALALDIFRYQYTNNGLYRQYCDLLQRNPEHVFAITEIPFLPIRFYKSHRVQTGDVPPQVIFHSSGTTGQERATHLVCDPGLYRDVSISCFSEVFGRQVSGERWLALLPSYLERGDASLVYMIRHFIAQGAGQGGFYLDNMSMLDEAVRLGESKGISTVLVGVTFALLEFAGLYPQTMRHTTVIETGGMKGRAPEITREQLHFRLREAFGLDAIGSEYGMTELLSQAWSTHDGIFQCGPTLRVLIRDLRDPFGQALPGERGGIDCIDLANIDSCAFLRTEDVGLSMPDGTFRVLGRVDGSEARGCNLMLWDN